MSTQHAIFVSRLFFTNRGLRRFEQQVQHFLAQGYCVASISFQRTGLFRTLGFAILIKCDNDGGDPRESDPIPYAPSFSHN